MTTPVKQTRKAGDTLLLSGTLGGDTLPDDAAWEDAEAKINIVTADGETVFVDHGDVTLDAPVEEDGVRTVGYSYTGPQLTDDDIGDYLYEIEVTFPGDIVLTFPNDRTKCKLAVVEQLA